MSSTPGVVLCQVCYKSFCRDWALKRHQRIHTGVKPYQCNECQRFFSRRDALVRHEISHLPPLTFTPESLPEVDPARPFPCGGCSRYFTRQDALMRHERRHRWNSRRRFREETPLTPASIVQHFIGEAPLTPDSIAQPFVEELPLTPESINQSFAEVHPESHHSADSSASVAPNVQASPGPMLRAIYPELDSPEHASAGQIIQALFPDHDSPVRASPAPALRVSEGLMLPALYSELRSPEQISSRPMLQALFSTLNSPERPPPGPILTNLYSGLNSPQRASPNSHLRALFPQVNSEGQASPGLILVAIYPELNSLGGDSAVDILNALFPELNSPGQIPPPGSADLTQRYHTLGPVQPASVTTASRSNSITSFFLDECLHMFFVKYIPTVRDLRRASFIFRDCAHPLLLNAMALCSLYLGTIDTVANSEGLSHIAHMALETSSQNIITPQGLRQLAPAPVRDSAEPERACQTTMWMAQEIEQRALQAHRMLDGLISRLPGDPAPRRHRVRPLAPSMATEPMSHLQALQWLSHLQASASFQAPSFRIILRRLYQALDEPNWPGPTMSAFSYKVILEGIRSLNSHPPWNEMTAVEAPTRDEICVALRKIYESVSLNPSLSSEDQFDTILRWHATCLELNVDTTLLCRNFCAKHATIQHLWLDGHGAESNIDLAVWVTTPAARSALLHAVAMRELIQKSSSIRAHSIRICSSLFAAATVFAVFAEEGRPVQMIPSTIVWQDALISEHPHANHNSTRYHTGEPSSTSTSMASGPPHFSSPSSRDLPHSSPPTPSDRPRSSPHLSPDPPHSSPSLPPDLFYFSPLSSPDPSHRSPLPGSSFPNPPPQSNTPTEMLNMSDTAVFIRGHGLEKFDATSCDVRYELKAMQKVFRNEVMPPLTAQWSEGLDMERVVEKWTALCQ